MLCGFAILQFSSQNFIFGGRHLPWHQVLISWRTIYYDDYKN